MTKRTRITAIWKHGDRWFVRDATDGKYLTTNQFMAGAVTAAKESGALVDLEFGRGWWRVLRDVTPVTSEGATA